MSGRDTQNRLGAALTALGINQREIAVLCGLHAPRLSALANGHLVDTPRTTEQKRAICRRGLMVQAALLGLPDDEVWRYGEHAIFGLPECDRELVLGEVRAQAERIRSERLAGTETRPTGTETRPTEVVPSGH